MNMWGLVTFLMPIHTHTNGNLYIHGRQAKRTKTDDFNAKISKIFYRGARPARLLT